MSHFRTLRDTPQKPPASRLVICDRLIGLAQDADRAGFAVTAEHLLHLAYNVFEEPRIES